MCIHMYTTYPTAYNVKNVYCCFRTVYISIYIYIRMVYPVGLLCMYMCKCVYIYIYDGYPLGLHALMLINIISYGDPIGLLIL